MTFPCSERCPKPRHSLRTSISSKRIGKCLFLLIFLLQFAPGVFCQEAHKIKLAAFEYPPFFSKQSNEICGIAVELGNALFMRLHLETELTMYPFKRALNYVKRGIVDGIMILVKTADREKYLIYSTPLIPANGYIYSAADRKGGPVNFDRLEDLSAYKVGVTIGYSYGTSMDKLLLSMDTDSAPKEYNSFQKLMRHRVDIIPATDIIVMNMIKNHPEFKDKFFQSSKPFLESAYYVGISKKSELARMMPEINKTISNMTTDGTIDKIVKKYTE